MSKSYDAHTGRSLGDGAPLYAGLQDNEYRFRSIRTKGAITATVDDETITLAADTGLTYVALQGDGIEITTATLNAANPSTKLSLSEVCTTPGSFERPAITVGADGRITDIRETDPEPRVTITGSPVVEVVGLGPSFAFDLKASPVGAGTYAPSKITLDDYGRIIAVEEAVAKSDAVEASGSPVEAILTDTGVEPGTYDNPWLTVDAKGRVTAIGTSPVEAASPSLDATGVAAGSYENPKLTIGMDGRVTSASSSPSSILPKDGKPGQLLAMVGGRPTWHTPSSKVIPVDLPASQSWRLVVSAIDGDGLLAIDTISFRETVGGAPLPLNGTMICDDAGWGSNTPDKAFALGTWVSVANINSGCHAVIGYRFETSVVVREFAIQAGVEGYCGPTKIELQFLMGETWEKAWSVTTGPWPMGERRVFSIVGGAADEAFRTLADTPSTYLGQALKHVRVNQEETGLEFVHEPRRFGGTHERPDYHDQEIGVSFFDTSLGQPIWWTGSKWVDAMGGAV